MRGQVVKLGNNLAFCIPAPYAKALALEEGVQLEISLVDGAMLVQPVSRDYSDYSLEELVSQITPENRHEETDWGEAVGRELW